MKSLLFIIVAISWGDISVNINLNNRERDALPICGEDPTTERLIGPSVIWEGMYCLDVIENEYPT